jgi:hypothetical protein
MNIEKVFLEKKGQSLFQSDITLRVVSLMITESGESAQTEGLIPGDKVILKISSIPQELIPSKFYKNKVKIPKKVPVDILVSFRQGDFVSRFVRYKQPDPNSSKSNNSDKIVITVPNLEWSYVAKSNEQLVQWFNSKVENGISGFDNEAQFLQWYSQNIGDGKCAYCGLSERDSQRIVHEGRLTSLRFPIYGSLTKGVNRGYWLEIDRKNPSGFYSIDNCNPSCYFCNNDKSDVFTDEHYQEFFQNRARFLRSLLR